MSITMCAGARPGGRGGAVAEAHVDLLGLGEAGERALDTASARKVDSQEPAARTGGAPGEISLPAPSTR